MAFTSLNINGDAIIKNTIIIPPTAPPTVYPIKSNNGIDKSDVVAYLEYVNTVAFGAKTHPI
jgi:hypothetical protein